MKWVPAMNNLVPYRTPSAAFGTFAAVGLTAAIAAGQAIWPAPETPVYVVRHNSSSHSSIENFLTFSLLATRTDFASEVAEFYAALLKGQEPLGADFEAIWDSNVDSLYES
ncbi:hypothetical protein MnTg02_01276 [bacterium MnTg02]|nr:hypothetical protein MnTg02_01276 [bacterium MnTg02]